MTEFVPVWMVSATLLYLGGAMVAALVTVGWVLLIAGDKPDCSLPDFADAFRDPGIVAMYVLWGVALVGLAAGVLPLAEVAAVAAGLLTGAELQLNMIKAAVVYHSTARGEAA